MERDYIPVQRRPVTDLHEDMAAEQKARTTYDNILRLVKDPEVQIYPFPAGKGDCALPEITARVCALLQDHLDSKNFYAFNPEFDMGRCTK